MQWQQTYQVLEAFAGEVESLYKEKLRQEGISGLPAAVQREIHVEQGGYTVSLRLDEYWQYIEQGRKAGGKFPPPDTLLRWVRSKPVLPRAGGNGKLPTEQQLAFLAGRKIARQGIPARPFLQESADEAYNRFAGKLEAAFAADVEAYLATLLQTITNK